MKKLTLIIEKAESGYLGRIIYNTDLIVDEADTLSNLETNIKKALKKYHGLKVDELQFEHKYDLSALFEKFNYLKISNIAEIAGINSSLLRQYVIGNKHASASQAKKIETTIHKIGKDLLTVQVYGKGSS